MEKNGIKISINVFLSVLNLKDLLEINVNVRLAMFELEVSVEVAQITVSIIQSNKNAIVNLVSKKLTTNVNVLLENPTMNYLESVLKTVNKIMKLGLEENAIADEDNKEIKMEYAILPVVFLKKELMESVNVLMVTIKEFMVLVFLLNVLSEILGIQLEENVDPHAQDKMK